MIPTEDQDLEAFKGTITSQVEVPSDWIAIHVHFSTLEVCIDSSVVVNAGLGLHWANFMIRLLD